MARTALAAASIALLSLGSLGLTYASPTSALMVIQSGAPHYQQPGPVRIQYQAPPPPRHEATPRQRRGQVWVPGHWEWKGRQYVWMQGYWVKARPGYYYRPHRWEDRDGRWHMQPGGWDRDRDGISNRYDRDRDGDGVPNRYDRTPDGRVMPPGRDRDGDGVPNRYDRDRDGDGVPNRRDHHPSNPYRN